MVNKKIIAFFFLMAIQFAPASEMTAIRLQGLRDESDKTQSMLVALSRQIHSGFTHLDSQMKTLDLRLEDVNRRVRLIGERVCALETVICPDKSRADQQREDSYISRIEEEIEEKRKAFQVMTDAFEERGSFYVDKSKKVYIKPSAVDLDRFIKSLSEISEKITQKTLDSERLDFYRVEKKILSCNEKLKEDLRKAECLQRRL